MSLLAFALIGTGAALGAWLRWLLSTWLNPIYQPLPLGTLAANLSGGYLMGLALGVFQLYPGISHETRWFITTGFLGGLTTFSTFSAEVSGLLLRQHPWQALTVLLSHTGGSIALTCLGILSVHGLASRLN